MCLGTYSNLALFGSSPSQFKEDKVFVSLITVDKKNEVLRTEIIVEKLSDTCLILPITPLVDITPKFFFIP